jgi:hypothetical protein
VQFSYDGLFRCGICKKYSKSLRPGYCIKSLLSFLEDGVYNDLHMKFGMETIIMHLQILHGAFVPFFQFYFS